MRVCCRFRASHLPQCAARIVIMGGMTLNDEAKPKKKRARWIAAACIAVAGVVAVGISPTSASASAMDRPPAQAMGIRW